MNTTTQTAVLFITSLSTCVSTSLPGNDTDNNTFPTNSTTDCGSTVGVAGRSFEDFEEFKVALIINKYYLYIICGIGIPGNIAALVTVWKMKPLSSSSIFMIALASMDTLTLVIKELYYQLTYFDIQMFDLGCQFFVFIGQFAGHYANWILVAMTTERFIAIRFPMKVQKICTKTKVITALLVIAVAMIVLNVHHFATVDEGYDSFSKYQCSTKKDHEFFMTKIWYWMDGVAFSVAPFCALIILNFFIINGIRDSVKKQRDLTNLQQKQTKQHNQITVMLVTVSLVFTLLTLPNSVFFISRGYWDYKKSNYQIALHLLIYQLVFVLTDLNHAVNFYLYFLSGKKFRKHFISMLRCASNTTTTTRTTLTRSSRYQMSVTSTPSNHTLVEHDSACSRSISNTVT